MQKDYNKNATNNNERNYDKGKIPEGFELITQRGLIRREFGKNSVGGKSKGIEEKIN